MIGPVILVGCDWWVLVRKESERKLSFLDANAGTEGPTPQFILREDKKNPALSFCYRLTQASPVVT
jgi:hypothetical protein